MPHLTPSPTFMFVFCAALFILFSFVLGYSLFIYFVCNALLTFMLPTPQLIKRQLKMLWRISSGYKILTEKDLNSCTRSIVNKKDS